MWDIMKEQTMAKFTGLTFLLQGIMSLVAAVLGIVGMIQVGPTLSAAADMMAALPGAPPVGMYLLLMWVVLLVLLVVGVSSTIAGIGWLKYKFETAA
jgi:uncharacterized membrane protein